MSKRKPLNNPPLVRKIPRIVMKVNSVSKRKTSARNPVATPIYPKGIISEGFFKLLAKKIKVIEATPAKAITITINTNSKSISLGSLIYGVKLAITPTMRTIMN